MFSSFFLRRWTSPDAALTAVVADVVDFAVFDGFVVDIVYVHNVDGDDRAVIEEVPAVPPSSDEADAEVSETVRDSTIEADVRPPVTLMEKKRATVPAPPGRSPQVTHFGSLDPCSWHPVVIAAIPCPVTRRPEVAVTGANGLFVNRQRGRSKGDRYADL